CRSPRLPTPRRCRSEPNAMSRIQLQLCDVKSPCASPSYLTDAHAAPNLGQIEKIDDTFDAVGLRIRPAWIPAKRYASERSVPYVWPGRASQGRTLSGRT